MLKKTYPEIDAKSSQWIDKIFDFTEFMAKKGYFPDAANSSKKKDVFYHYSCHYLNELKLKEEPKKILQALGFKPKEELEPFTCCGFCGVFSLKNPEISAHMWQKKKQKILENETDLVATDCPGCLFQLRANLKREGNSLKIFHTAELYAKVTEQTLKQQKNDRS